MRRQGVRLARSVAAATAVVFAVALCALAAAAAPSPAGAAGESLASLQTQAAQVRRDVAKLDHEAEVATEKYNVARAELDAVNIRLVESRRAYERVQSELDAAQTLLGQRISTMYKSDDYTVLDVLFSVTDFSQIGTQLDYFASISRADQDSVDKVAAMRRQLETLTRQIEADRQDSLKRELALREQQAEIEDQLAARETLLTQLDARVKKLLAEQSQLDAAAARRLAREAGIDVATISGSPAQIGVVKETMKYLGIPYVWGGASPSGGFDCSGLVLYVYKKFGVDFPHGATLEARMGHPVPMSQAQPADLVFFGTPAFYSHVGIYIGDGLFIEAPHTGDVVKVSKVAGRGVSLVCRYPIRVL